MRDRRREELLAALSSHAPADHREEISLRQTLALVGWLPAPFDEDADPTHVTVSGIALDRRGRVLLHRHKLLGTWLQPGGHVDGPEKPPDAVIREVREETGLSASHPDGKPRLLHVDVHEGPRGHVHLDLRYLLVVGDDGELRPGSDESQEVAWLEVTEAASRADAGLRTALARIHRR